MSDLPDDLSGDELMQPNLGDLLKNGGQNRPDQVARLKALADEYFQLMLNEHIEYTRNFSDSADPTTYNAPAPTPEFVEVVTNLARARRQTFATLAFELFLCQKNFEGYKAGWEQQQMENADLKTKLEHMTGIAVRERADCVRVTDILKIAVEKLNAFQNGTCPALQAENRPN